MRAVVAKKLKEEARLKSLDGSVIGNAEYKKMKKKYTNPHYAPVVDYGAGDPMERFRGEMVKVRMVKYPFK